MDNIFIEPTDNSPKVVLDFENALIELEGSSYPENTFEFFEPINDWLNEYFSGNAKDGTTINIKLKYFNSATTQALFDIFDIVNDAKCNDLNINWYYDSNNKNSLEDYEDYADEFEELNIKAIAL